jgi:hypothetical protein
MPVIHEVTETTLTIYRVAGQTIQVETRDDWATKAVAELFKGWYLDRETSLRGVSLRSTIVVSSGTRPPELPRNWLEFEIAGGGICLTDGEAFYIDIEGSIIAVGCARSADVEVWTNGPLELQAPALTRVITYALAAALRRRRLFELHSGAVLDPASGQGVLIIGPSGSGKSTLTVQLATAGWPFLTDDVLLLSEAGRTIKAWPLRRNFAITSETFAASSFLQGHPSVNYLRAEPCFKEYDKQQFVPGQVFESELQEQCIPSTLLFTQISSSVRSQVLPLTPAETMTRLIRMNPWSCYDRATAASHLEVLAALVKQSTGYALSAGKDLLDPHTAANLIGSCTRT